MGNIDAAEAYYHHFFKDKMLPLIALTNLAPCWPMRQKAGPDAAVSDGNVKAWVTNPARLAEGPQTIKYNHLKIESNPGGKVEVVEWATAPTPAPREAVWKITFWLAKQTVFGAHRHERCGA